ncbi:uncharacterized protein LOC130641549 isoform X1 [Hydractinia symbiolongicarpus]|uniref:uncharacterized protein LOC130641549 isoform X1 n=1 Tax=Hydractinia symbiolongicarpus TaxID=13093 RepID=UPI00254F1739|nr:uncharacterized protein LOC130641549 isoform X1 [Hydractinia symbiolongicarpus]
MVLLVRDKVRYLGLKSLKLIKTNEELRYNYGDKCMLSLRKQLKKISHASILKLKEGQKTVIEVEGEHTYNEKYNLSSINVHCDTIIFIVLKEPYMIIRDREKETVSTASSVPQQKSLFRSKRRSLFCDKDVQLLRQKCSYIIANGPLTKQGVTKALEGEDILKNLLLYKFVLVCTTKENNYEHICSMNLCQSLKRITLR